MVLLPICPALHLARCMIKFWQGLGETFEVLGPKVFCKGCVRKLQLSKDRKSLIHANTGGLHGWPPAMY